MYVRFWITLKTLFSFLLLVAVFQFPSFTSLVDIPVGITISALD